jgi:phosphatidylglycerophosphate synthase
MLIFPVLYLATFQDSTSNWIALGLFVFAGITDHLDGFIARKTGTSSSLGGLLDLIADKLLNLYSFVLFYFFSLIINFIDSIFDNII